MRKLGEEKCDERGGPSNSGNDGFLGCENFAVAASLPRKVGLLRSGEEAMT